MVRLHHTFSWASAVYVLTAMKVIKSSFENTGKKKEKKKKATSPVYPEGGGREGEARGLEKERGWDVGWGWGQADRE